ncbi:MAG TPA: 2-amino-4-hydroxy-6-hydroxymethyldihydropteridine diphosphokinase [Minicystis sp.]|nr:2-amino-4-hydroxy-6-hydroxymethyldihydropteridine diphosphokinase [Minicystis sp.]
MVDEGVRPRRVVIGLGANLGDRAGAIEAAVRALAAEPGIGVAARSGVYETAPVGGPPQGDYLNMAVLARSRLGARALVERLLAIEAALGRVRREGERDAPRTIDLDLLWIEGERVDDPGVVVPHPRLAARAFALVPLVDVAPDARDPTTGVRYAELAAAKQPLRRVDRGPTSGVARHLRRRSPRRPPS